MESKDLLTHWVKRERKRECRMDTGMERERGRARGKRELVVLLLLLPMKRKNSEPGIDDSGVIDLKGVWMGSHFFH